MLDTVCYLFQEANPHASIKMIKNWTRKTLSDFPQFCWVIKKEGEIIGAVAGLVITSKKGEIRKYGVIDDIAVDELYRGRGYGTLLMQKILDSFKDASVNRVKLSIHYLNANVVPFYYKFGFRLSNIKTNAFGERQDAIEMELTLDEK